MPTTNVILDNMSFQDIIEHLETVACGVYVPGTMLNRVLLDDKIAKAYKLGPSPFKGTKAWCLSLGKLNEPKLHFYGWTISEVVKSAWGKLISGETQA